MLRHIKIILSMLQKLRVHDFLFVCLLFKVQFENVSLNFPLPLWKIYPSIEFLPILVDDYIINIIYNFPTRTYGDISQIITVCRLVSSLR